MIATIFDIDGTLVESFGFDGTSYISAVREVLGEVHIDDDWSQYKNVTDTGILRQIKGNVNFGLKTFRAMTHS